MVSSLRPIVRLLDDPTPPTDGLVEPRHEPIRSAFIPHSSGFFLNEMKSYLEWWSANAEFSWMNEEWEYVEDLYSYWPYLENAALLSPDPYYYAYTPSVVYAIVRVENNSFTVMGVCVLDSPPGLGIIETIENRHPGSGITRLNISLVPLEMIDVPEETVQSVVHYWVDTLRTLDWSVPRYRLDSMVFWSNRFRDRINSMLAYEDRVHTYLVDDVEGRYTPTQQDMLKIEGLVFDHPTFNDPLASSSFVAEICDQVPELGPDITAQEISYFFQTGMFVPSIGSDPGVYYKLNDILCTYPEDVQERLYLGVGTSLDPRDVDTIGAGFSNGNKPTREGQRLLTYEDLLQPRP